MGGKTGGPKVESGGGVLGEGVASPLLTIYGSGGGAVSSSSGIRGGAQTAQRFSTIFSTQGGLS